MGKLRLVVGVVLAGAALYWLYPKPVREAADDAVEITIWFNGPIEGRQLDVIDAFERRFPQYRANLGSSAVRTGLEGEGNPQRLMCGIAGGVPPEVVEYDRFAVCQWAARGAFKDLSDLITHDAEALAAAAATLNALRAESRASDSPEAKHRLAESETLVERLGQCAVRPSDYYAPTWNECTYRGGQYGIPNYMDDRVLYCNADMLVRAGFVDGDGKPKPPDSWEQILSKRLDVRDAIIQGDRVHCDSADFISSGVRPGDTLAHISERGAVTRCIVERIDGPNDLFVRPAYARRDLSLPDRAGQHIKVFDGTGYALSLARWDEDGRISIVGMEPQHGNAWLYLYGWANGGEFLSEDGRTCTLNEDRIVEALQWTTDLYDALGGADSINAFKKSFQTAAQDPFLMGQIALFIHGDWFLRDLARYKRDMRFMTHPAPVPQRRIDTGERNCTWVAGFAYCIPATCPPEKLEAAWTLVKFLSSVEGGMVMNEHDAQRERSQGRLYVPRMTANRRLNELQIEQYVQTPEMPDRLRHSLQTHLDMLPYGRYRPVSPQGQLLWNAQADAQDLAWSHSMSPRAALDYQSGRVQRALDAFHADRGEPQYVNWMRLVWLYGAAIIAVVAGVYIRWRRTGRAGSLDAPGARAGPIFALPWLLGFVVLSGGPMVFSGIMSLTRYDVINPAEFVGLDNYREMFTVDWGGPGADGAETVPTGIRRSFLNTLFMAIGLPIGMAIGLALAMLLNTKVSGLRTYRTFFFLPAIMPVVAASILWIWVFNAQNGLLNWLLRGVGIEQAVNWMNVHLDWFNLRTPISWLTNKDTSKPALIIMTLWGAGSSMIIWLAGLKDIPVHLYEAAQIDGAGPLRRFFRITLPMLSPYILFNLIIGLIQTFQIFTQAYIMTPNGYPERSTYFYVYKLFDECFSYFRLGYGAAMAWVLFVILAVLTLFNMLISRKWVYYAGD